MSLVHKARAHLNLYQRDSNHNLDRLIRSLGREVLACYSHTHINLWMIPIPSSRHFLCYNQYYEIFFDIIPRSPVSGLSQSVLPRTFAGTTTNRTPTLISQNVKLWPFLETIFNVKFENYELNLLMTKFNQFAASEFEVALITGAIKLLALINASFNFNAWH